MGEGQIVADIFPRRIGRRWGPSADYRGFYGENAERALRIQQITISFEPADEWASRRCDDIPGGQVNHLVTVVTLLTCATCIRNHKARSRREIDVFAGAVDKLSLCLDVVDSIAAVEHVRQIASIVRDDDLAGLVDIIGVLHDNAWRARRQLDRAIEPVGHDAFAAARTGHNGSFYGQGSGRQSFDVELARKFCGRLMQWQERARQAFPEL